MLRRYEAHTPNNFKVYGRISYRNPGIKVIFQDQRDLLYVRKHLATGLLGTCTEVYNEAADLFWGSNIWRFSGDEDWVVLYRFLLTIGPVARTRIHRLDVAGICTSSDIQPLPTYENWQTKNHPKLHMTKLWWNKWRTAWPHCRDFVFEILMREKSLRELNLLVPYGYRLRCAEGWENIIPFDFLPRVRIVVELGGVLYGGSEVAIAGWDLLGLPGSDVLNVMDNGLNYFAKTTDQECVWRSTVDHLTGVSQLFETEEISVHANNGRARIPGKGQKMARELKAFGPCVVVVDIFPCSCGYSSKPWWCRWHRSLGVRYKSLVDIHDSEMMAWLTDFDL